MRRTKRKSGESSSFIQSKTSRDKSAESNAKTTPWPFRITAQVDLFYAELRRNYSLGDNTAFVGMHIRKTDYTRALRYNCKGLESIKASST